LIAAGALPYDLIGEALAGARLVLKPGRAGAAPLIGEHMEAPADACPRCGETGQLASACNACGESLLVDLILQEGIDDERLRYRAARALVECGPPAPSLLEAKRGLESAGARLLANVSRSFALRAASALDACGVSASPQPARPRKRLSLALAAAALAAVALATGSVLVLRPGPWRPAENPPVRPSTLAKHPGAVRPDESAAVNLSTEELGRRALKSVATVVCASRIGAGFFIEPEKLVTNAHVACPVGEIARVRLQDGRELLGKTVARDDWIDTATLEVAGAAAQPLIVGDATALKAGEPIALVGSPSGLEFTLHEGKVSFVGRNYLGVGYVQINASVNPGNSGGPLLNGAGEVVGIVSLKILHADGIGLALPIQYVRPPGPGDPAAARWSALLAKVRDQDLREMDKLVSSQELELASVRPSPGGLDALVIQRWSSPPVPTRLRLELWQSEARTCELPLQIRSWATLSKALDWAKDERRVKWMLKSPASKELYVGVGALDLGACPREALARGGALLLHQGAEGRAYVEGATLDAAGARAREESQRLEERKEQEGRWHEESWRDRFRQARARIANLESRIRQVRGEVERVESGLYRLTPEEMAEYEKKKRWLAGSDAEREKAQEALRDLDRAASNQAVPRKWRE
jgi:S1-C subfamily serine protease